MPHRDTIHAWKRDNKEFSDQYTQARQAQADFFAEECLEIADNATPEDAAVARLRVDTRKWIACKLHPRTYGEKPGDIHVSNTVNNFVVLTEARQQELQTRMQEALRR